MKTLHFALFRIQFNKNILLNLIPDSLKTYCELAHLSMSYYVLVNLSNSNELADKK